MAYSVLHGPPAMDAFHEWAPATGTAPPVINDTNTEQPEFPRIVLERPPAGWRSLPELTDNRAPRTFSAGEITYPSRRLGKTLVYECTLQCNDDREDFLLEQNAIVQGFADQDDEGVMTVTPWPVPGGVVWTYSARVLDLQFDPEWTLDGEREIVYSWGFVLTLRLSEPLYYTGGNGYV